MTPYRTYEDWLDKQRYRQDDEVGKFASWQSSQPDWEQGMHLQRPLVPDIHLKGWRRSWIEFLVASEHPMSILLGDEAVRYQQLKYREQNADNIPVGENTTGDDDETVDEDTAGDAGGGTGDVGDGAGGEG